MDKNVVNNVKWKKLAVFKFKEKSVYPWAKTCIKDKGNAILNSISYRSNWDMHTCTYTHAHTQMHIQTSAVSSTHSQTRKHMDNNGIEHLFL